MGMGWFAAYKPVFAMVGVQFGNAVLALTARAAFAGGLSPRIYIVYALGVAALVMATAAYFSQRGKASEAAIGKRSFCMMFIAALVGVTINQNAYYQGLYMTSSSMAVATSNLIPAITFLIAALIGLEEVNVASTRSMAKVVGTIICVGGAVSMALFKGPELLHGSLATPITISDSAKNDWLIGCLLLLASSFCWSFWLILQVPIIKIYPDSLSLSAWICFLSFLQLTIVTIFLEPDPSEWILSSFVLLCCIYAGVVGVGASYYLQSWCASKRGPLFSAMFNPLGTVIVTVLGFVLLHEVLYLGSLLGAVAVVCGLYSVIWGKAEDLDLQVDAQHRDNGTEVAAAADYKIDLGQPLLA